MVCWLSPGYGVECVDGGSELEYAWDAAIRNSSIRALGQFGQGGFSRISAVVVSPLALAMHCLIRVVSAIGRRYRKLRWEFKKAISRVALLISANVGCKEKNNEAPLRVLRVHTMQDCWPLRLLNRFVSYQTHGERDGAISSFRCPVF